MALFNLKHQVQASARTFRTCDTRLDTPDPEHSVDDGGAWSHLILKRQLNV